MENINYAFFEAFKRLDSLCRDIYGSAHGVTSYIDHMKSTPWSRHRLVSNWDEDLQQLIRLRHKRNHLAHAANAFDEEICTEEDICYLERFHERILSQSDPISQVFQIQRNSQPPKKPAPRTDVPRSVSADPPAKSRKKPSVGAFWILAAVMILLLFFFFR